MSDVDDLVAWLRAQLTEDEMVVADMDTVFGDVLGTRERALAELDPKRRILDMGGNFEVYSEPYTSFQTWKHAVRLLALPYADRPGYRPAWRP